jgi:hypothetical protein
MSASSAAPGGASSLTLATNFSSEPSGRSAFTWRGPETPLQPGTRAPARLSL